MNELTINGEVYSFKFGFGFIRKIGGEYQVPVTGIPGAKKDAGLLLAIANVYDGDLLTLVKVLDVANEGQTPRLTRKQIEEFLENEDTDVQGVIDTVMGFLSRANCCKKTVDQVMELAKEQEEAKKTKA